MSFRILINFRIVSQCIKYNMKNMKQMIFNCVLITFAMTYTGFQNQTPSFVQKECE